MSTVAADVHRYLQPTFRTDQVSEMARGVAGGDGFALIPGVLSRAEVAEARAEIDRLRPFHFDNKDDPLKDHYKCIFNRSPYWLRYLDEPGVVDLAERTMGEDCLHHRHDRLAPPAGGAARPHWTRSSWHPHR